MGQRKIAVFVNDDDFFYADGLKKFLAQTKFEISGIFTFPGLVDPIGKRKYTIASALIVGPLFVLKYIFSVRKHSLKSVAKEYKIPYFKIDSVNSEETKALIPGMNINLVLSLCSQIYRKEILNIPQLKILNFHPSLLPSHKGRFPIFWAIMKNSVQGFTCHEITEKIDSGRILFQKKFNLQGRVSVAEILNEFISRCPEFLEEALNRNFEGRFEELTSITRTPSYEPTPNLSEIIRYWFS